MKTYKNNKKVFKVILLLIGIAMIFSFGFNTISAASTNSTQDNLTTVQATYTNFTYINNTKNSSTLPDPQIWRNGVNVGDYTTITDAVNNAQSGDTIILEPGTYYENNININTNLTIEGGTQTNTIIDATGSDNIFIITPDIGITLTLINMTLQNGTGQNNGGAIDYENNYDYGTLNIINSTFTNNYANNGGAIDTYNVNLNVINSTFYNNTASNGGAISYTDDGKGIVAMNSTNNTYTYNNAFNWGTIYNNGNMNDDSSTYNNNNAHEGGAIYNDWKGALTETNCTFIINSGYYGGAIYNLGILNGMCNTYIGNTASDGGAICNDGGTFNETNSTYTSNIAQSYGGAIDNFDGGSITETGSMLTINSADQGGAVYNTYDATFSFCSLSGNTVDSIGGAIYNGGSLTNNNNTYIQNNANVGGAQYNDADSIITESNSTYTSNIATTGGAIYNNGISINNNNTYTSNIATTGGAFYNDNLGSLLVSNSTLYNNVALIGNAIYNIGTSNINFNRIIGTGTLINSDAGTVDATNNWWGSNNSPSGEVSGNVDVSTWLVLNINASSTGIAPNGNSIITADLTHDQSGVYYDPTNGHVPDGIPITFTSTLGTLTPINSSTINGVAFTTFTAGILPGVANINVIIDNFVKSVTLTIGSVDIVVQNLPWYYDTVSGYQNTYMYHNWPEYVLGVENIGTNDATGVTVTYTIGSGLKYITSSTQGIGTTSYNPNTNTITWNIGNMPTTGMVFMLISTQAIETGNQTPALTTTATLTHVDQYDTPNKYKTSNYKIIVPTDANVQVNQTATTNNNNTVTYTITVTNNGPDNATGIQITDQLPNGLTYTTSTPSTGTYNPTTGIWNIGNITNGTTQTLTITANITETEPITNTAILTAEDQDNWNYNNNAQTTTIEKPN